MPLWIDAVCINQDDLDEKTAQVRMMKEIYSGAVEVVAWLGPASGNDKRGMAFVNTLYNVLNAQMTDMVDLLTTAHFETPEELGLPGLFDECWKDLCGILYKPYFFRVVSSSQTASFPRYHYSQMLAPHIGLKLPKESLKPDI